MINVYLSLFLDLACLAFSIVFLWSTFVVLVGIVRSARRHPAAEQKLKFAAIVCARNEERVIELPVKSILAADYPADLREVIVIADNCRDATAELARRAGATVWEKSTPSHGKGDVLEWGLERLGRERPEIEAIAVFDADNQCSSGWFTAMNNALSDGETVVTGRRFASNRRASLISGWYTVYWAMMNELSNRVRTNLGLSGKLTGTGLAFSAALLRQHGWHTHTLVEDVEFTVQTNLRGGRVAYVPEAEYCDEQPVTVKAMWRQLRRWATGGWQVVAGYSLVWFSALRHHPSLRLFDSFFAILTGMSVAFILLFNFLALVVRLLGGQSPWTLFLGVFGFLFVMGWFTAIASAAFSPRSRRASALAILTFPLFSIILSLAVLYTRVLPTRTWKPIQHGG